MRISAEERESILDILSNTTDRYEEAAMILAKAGGAEKTIRVLNENRDMLYSMIYAASYAKEVDDR